MKTPLLTVVILLCVVIARPTVGQNLSSEIVKYPGPFEYNLGNPNYAEGTQVIPVGIDLWEGNEVNRIYYGKTPSNSSSKPVLLFVHGYASNAQVFFKGEDNMYADVYRDGYRSAYVSLTPNDDMWTNGFMLAAMITKIKARYNNAPLVLVGWSKGGVDIDAALVHFGANNKVSEVFTLSTPHFGTGIAELANSELLSLVNIIFMQDNDGTLSLQRGYMSYFRSITDNNSKNTVPYTTIGGWGNGPLNRLSVPQNLLYLLGGSKDKGGNDGVVPYKSSIRPGAKELFGGLKKYSGLFGPYYDGPNQTNLDHFEVTRGNKVWPYIKNELRQSTNGRVASNQTFQNPNTTISSRMQWATSVDDNLVIGPNNQNSQLIVLSDSEEAITLINDQSQPTTLYPTVLQKDNPNGKVFTLENLQPGKYRMKNKETIAFLLEESGPEMTLNIRHELLHVSTNGLLDIDLTFNGLKDNQEVEIEAYLTPTVDLNLNRLEPQKLPLEVERKDNQYNFYTNSPLKNGIYQLVVHAQSTDFKRDLLTSLAINELELEVEDNITDNWTLYPNPAKETVTIQFDNIANESKLTVFTLTGEVVYKTAIQPGTRSFQWTTINQPNGIYIVEWQQTDRKVHKKLLIDN